jgi:Fe2+ or Zn2+ uptake regulation protein
MHCKQGHYIDYNNRIIENCHGWKAREKCECYYFEHAYYTSTAFKEHFNIVCKKCGRIIE